MRSIEETESPVAQPGDEGTRDLRDYWLIVRERPWLAGAFFAGAVASALAIGFLSDPVYRAHALLVIEPQTPRVIDIENVLEGDAPGVSEKAFYNTQHAILRSRDLAARVIARQGLADDDFAPTRLHAKLIGELVALLPKLREPPPARVPDGSIDPEKIDAYVERLGVHPVRESRVVRLTYESADPELAAEVVNAHAAEFIKYRQRLHQRASEDAEGLLKAKLAELGKRIETSEEALNTYRKQLGIVSLHDKENVVIDRLAQLNARLTESEIARINREADVQPIRRGTYSAVPAVNRSELVRELKQQLAVLENENARLSAAYKPDSLPRAQVADVRAAIAQLRRRLDTEIANIVASVEAQYEAATRVESQLRAAFEEQKLVALRLKDSEIEYALLEREAETNRTLFESVLQRVKELGMASGVYASNVSVIDPAYPPTDPSSPRILRDLTQASLFGLLGGCALALLFGLLDNTLRTTHDVESATGLRSIGTVPDFAQLNLTADPLAARLAARIAPRLTPTASRLSSDVRFLGFEVYRSIRTSIQLASDADRTRTILFTSANRGEGKTVTAMNTAAMFAQLGGRVLFIDADFRHSHCERSLGLRRTTGLAEVLAGKRKASDAIRRTETLPFLLARGRTPPNPTELLGSEQMKQLLAELRQQYDYVIIDAPSLASASDAVILAALADAVVLVVEQQRTPRRRVQQAAARLADARANVLGTVLNRIDRRWYDHPLTNG